MMDTTLATIVERKCLKCTGNFSVKRSQVWRGNGKFCSKSCSISYYHKGKTQSKEAIEKIRKANLGKKHSQETITKIVATRKRGEESNFFKHGKSGYQYKLYLNRRRRVTRLRNGGSHTYEEWEKLVKDCSHTCLACSKKEPEIVLTVDHIVPLSKGGTDDITNIQPLCRSCNSKKSIRIVRF